MASIVERIGALAGTELSKAIDLAHRTYQDRLGQHRHVGRALVETVAEVCRNHPNLVGVGVGVLVEQLLLHAKEKHDARETLLGSERTDLVTQPRPGIQSQPFVVGGVADDPGQVQPDPAPVGLKNAHLPHHMLKLSDLHPRRVAFEVFGGILLLKLAATGAKMFRHKHQAEVWFAPASTSFQEPSPPTTSYRPPARRTSALGETAPSSSSAPTR